MSRILLAVSLLLSLAGSVFTQQVSDLIRVDTRLVSVPVIVSDRNGRYIPNLTKSDFSIFQDGVEQSIDFFATTEEPLTIALLIDTSQSTRPVLDEIKDSAKALVKMLLLQDRAMIASFDYDTHVLSTLTSDKDQLNKAIKEAEVPRGLIGTRLRDAAHLTINRVFRPIKGRKAVIILTDGKDAGSRISEDDLLQSLEESDTLVYTIMFKTERLVRPEMTGIYGRMPRAVEYPPFPDQGNRARRTERIARMNREAGEFLRLLSETTAGRAFSSNSGKLKNIFTSVIEELRFQYRIGFYPPDEAVDGSYHTLKVRVSRPDTVVRSRTGYRAKPKQ